jgi:uridine kinase
MIERIVKRDGRVVAFDREKITTAVYSAAVACGGRDREEAGKITDVVIAELEEMQQSGRSDPTVEEVQDLVEKTLIERGHARTAKAYILYRYEHAMKRAGRESLTYSSENIPYRKLWEALSWATDHDCVSLEQLSRIVQDGKLPDLIQASEGFYEDELVQAAEKILCRKDELKIIIIAGPSSSGKTTTTLKLRERLEAAGMATVPLAVDNYFYDLEFHPKVGDDWDFETPQALDLALIDEHLRDLVQGKSVGVPNYNFRTGKREGSSGTLRLEEGDVLLIDSLHGLFPQMTAGVQEKMKFRLYIETLSALKDRERRYIRWSDVRMLRRIVRDMQFRSYSPLQTIRHWHLVRRSELRYIVPELRKAHAIVNSFLPYELPFMKSRVERHLPSLLAELAQGPDREDARDRTVRVAELFSQIPAVEDESVVPSRSLLREFIGGSSIAY